MLTLPSYSDILLDTLTGELSETCTLSDSFSLFKLTLRSVKEHLGQRIQTAGAAGHSSVEDSIATLNLVRFYVLNKPKFPMKAPQPPKAQPAIPPIPKRDVITID